MKRLAAYLAPAVLLLGGFVAMVAAEVPQGWIIRISAIAATGMATLGCFAAVAVFERGDYLRRAWVANGLGYVALFASALLRRPSPPEWIAWTRVGLTLVANLSGVAGAILFARTYRAAGLDLPIPAPIRLGTLAMTAGLASLAAGIPVFENAYALWTGTGEASAWLGIFSSAGDGIMLTLIAPLVMTAFALRGGALAHTFWLLSASYAGWLLFDGQDTFDFFFRPEGAARQLLVLYVEPFRGLACAMVFSAALAQRAVVREGA